jgi:hypothetical protein
VLGGESRSCRELVVLDERSRRSADPCRSRDDRTRLAPAIDDVVVRAIVRAHGS